MVCIKQICKGDISPCDINYMNPVISVCQNIFSLATSYEPLFWLSLIPTSTSLVYFSLLHLRTLPLVLTYPHHYSLGTLLPTPPTNHSSGFLLFPPVQAWVLLPTPPTNPFLWFSPIPTRDSWFSFHNTCQTILFRQCLFGNFLRTFFKKN